MRIGDWIALAAGVPPWIGVVLVAITRLTRLVVAVETLTKQMAKVVDEVRGHKQRLDKGGL